MNIVWLNICIKNYIMFMSYFFFFLLMHYTLGIQIPDIQIAKYHYRGMARLPFQKRFDVMSELAQQWFVNFFVFISPSLMLKLPKITFITKELLLLKIYKILGCVNLFRRFRKIDSLLIFEGKVLPKYLVIENFKI